MSSNTQQTLPEIRPRPRLAVFKFASCDGCQLSLLDCEDELLAIAGAVDIVYFLEASSHVEPGPYDIALVEGSITTEHDARRIQDVRQQSRFLVTLGACATAGGIQSLKNWADHEEFLRCVYARPEYISTLATSTPIADHVRVDFALRGCVCLDCKRRGVVCVEVAQQIPCLGPVTQAGCGALCPTYNRGCYGCFGPAAQSNCGSLVRHFESVGATGEELLPLLRNFNAAAPAFRAESDRLESERSMRGGS